MRNWNASPPWLRSAVGYDETRGDHVEVINLRFAEAPNKIETEAPASGLFDFTKDDLFYAIELGVILLISLLAFLFGVRPLIKRIVTPDEKKEEAQALLTADGEPVAAIEGAGTTDSKDEPLLTNNAIALAQAEGEVHANTIATVGELIEENPNEAVVIVRSWLHDAING